MRATLHRSGPAVTLVLVVLLVIAPGASAAGLDPGSAARAVALRQDLGRVIDDYEALARQAPVHDEILRMLGEARTTLERIPDQDLVAFAPEIGSSVVQLRESARALRLEMGVPQPFSTSAKSEGLPNAPYPTVNWSFAIDAFTDIGQIPGSAGDTSVFGLCTYTSAPTPNQQFFMLNVDLAAEALRDTADRLCSFIASIVGEGGSLSLVCIVTDLLYAVEHSIKENWMLCGAVMGEAEMRAAYFRLKHVHDDLAAAESNLSGRLTQAETAISTEAGQNTGLLNILDENLVIHDQHLTASANQVDQQITAHLQAMADFRAASLRHHIEQRLSEADHGRVARFFLPEALGGSLETVRDIVGETIGESAAIGHDVRQAERFFTAADRELARLRYTSAFDLYGQAYRAAVQ